MKHHLFCDIQFNLDTNMQKKTQVDLCKQYFSI